MNLFKGVDVSLWQGTIDWNKVAKSGISFVMIKASQGRTGAYNAPFTDPKYKEYIEGAAKTDLSIGTYHYLCSRNKTEALAEAKYFVDIMKPYKNKINLWAAVDVEDDGFLGAHSKASLTECINVFCEYVKNAGFNPIVYANSYWLDTKFDVGNYPVWEANWGLQDAPNRKNLRLWQYTSKGVVAGINGNVDVNTIYIEGDVNNDGVVNNKDVALMTKKLAGYKVNIDTVSADVNNDGKFNLKDVSVLVKRLAGCSAKATTYTIKSGDSLWGIAEKYLGDGNRWKEIAELNDIDGTTIIPGQTIIIP